MANSARALVDHWAWAAEERLMNANTANALRVACISVLETEKDWESIDVATLDIDPLLRKFRSLKAKEYRPDSLKEYERRFRKAHASYLAYLREPSTWKQVSRERSSNNGRTAQPPERSDFAARTETPFTPPRADFVDYPFPLREGRIARLTLPIDLKAGEVKRLAAFLATLAVDGELGERHGAH